MSHDDAIALQSDITMVTNWISDCGLKLYSAKTKLMIISCKCSPPKLSVCIDGIPINQVESLKHLGVTTLSWSTHINSTCTKARKQLSFLYQKFYQANHDSIAYLYEVTFLPLLDYCCVWDPYQSTHTAKFEAAQRLAAKLATGLWPENYDHLLSLLNWPLLASRQQQQKLLLCRRILTGNFIIPPTISLHHSVLDLRHCHNFPLYRPPTHTQAHLGSYLVPLWNSTPYLPALNSLSSVP